MIQHESEIYNSDMYDDQLSHKDKEQLIEELAVTICNIKPQVKGKCDTCNMVNYRMRRNCKAFKYAARVINAGYRKIEE